MVMVICDNLILIYARVNLINRSNFVLNAILHIFQESQPTNFRGTHWVSFIQPEYCNVIIFVIYVTLSSSLFSSYVQVSLLFNTSCLVRNKLELTYVRPQKILYFWKLILKNVPHVFISLPVFQTKNSSWHFRNVKCDLFCYRQILKREWYWITTNTKQFAFLQYTKKIKFGLGYSRTSYVFNIYKTCTDKHSNNDQPQNLYLPTKGCFLKSVYRNLWLIIVKISFI